MKWGQVILDNTLYKWRSRYISYKALKRIITNLTEGKANSQSDEEALVLNSKFQSIVSTDLSKVESFYIFQMHKLGRQYEMLMKLWKTNKSTFSSHITYCLLNGLHTLRSQLKELKHYAFINAEGFRKIIKKYDKRLSTKTLSSYLLTFTKCKFYKHAELKEMILSIDQIVDKSGHKEESSNHSAINALIRISSADNESDLESVTNINSRNLSNLLESSQNEKISQLFTNAVRANKFEGVECIVEYFVNADDAANNNDNDHLRFLINARGYLGNTSLMTCCAVFGSMKIARLLLKHGADISLQNSYCRTALHIAAQRGHIEMLKLLLSVMEQRGQQELIHKLDKDMQNALHLGCLRRQYAASRLLIEFDSNVVNQQNADGATPLMTACSDRNKKHPQEKEKLISCILTECGNIDQRDWKMQSALHYACISGDDLVVDLLFKSKINPFVFDSNGMSPLHIAASHGQLNMVRKICEYCSNYSGHLWQSTVPIMDHTDNRGRTPLHLAAGKGFNDITKYLISIGANTKMLDDNKCNAHSYAWFNGVWTDECPPQRLEELKSNDVAPIEHLPMIKSFNDLQYCVLNASTAVSFMEPTKPPPTPSPSVLRNVQQSTSGCIVKFRIQCDTTSVQYLCILGDCEELGQWDVTRAVRMYENKMPSRVVTTDEETDYTDTEQQKEIARKKKEESEELEGSNTLKTWVCEVAFPQGTHVQYRYIVRVQSSLQSWEALPTERHAVVHESMIIDDGVFGQSPSLINRHRSYPKGMSTLDHLDVDSPQLEAMPNTQNYSELAQIRFSPSPSGPAFSPSSKGSGHRSKGGGRNRPREELRRYIQSGYLASDAQLQIRLGHITSPQKKPPLIVNNNIFIDRIVIRSGYINTNRYRGIRVNVSLPIKEEDALKVFKFQSHHKQINSLCSLEFEFYPRSGPSIARVFVLPSQILSKDSGHFTLALLSNSNDQRGGLLIGEFNFEYTLIRPFHHDLCGNTLSKTFQSRSDYNKTILIGHRGTGGHNSAKLPGPRRTHIQENTILAFNTAQSFGADFVEFDVQLTKDKVPIIYHDFLFKAHEFKIPINKISFRELQKYNIGKLRNRSPAAAAQESKKKRKTRMFIGSNQEDNTEGDTTSIGGASWPATEDSAATSTGAVSEETILERTPKSVHYQSQSSLGKAVTPDVELEDNPILPKSHSFSQCHSAFSIRKKLTSRHSQRNLSPHQFETFLNDHICSLSDVFERAPVDLGLNIEIKYPLHEECIEDGVENVVDLNEYVDTILKVVFDHDSSQRYIIFSSFHPEICKLVGLKQPQYPVLFLTEGGKSKYSDDRCNSLRNAIEMARSHSLFGVVTNTAAILKAPHLIDVVHEHGLILLSYGNDNNDPEKIDLQTARGIDGLISDHIQYVRGHLDSANNSDIGTDAAADNTSGVKSVSAFLPAAPPPTKPQEAKI